MRLKGKVSLITGAGSGIGRATALLFAREGALVVAADKDEQQVEKTQKLIHQAGGKCEAIANQNQSKKCWMFGTKPLPTAKVT